MHSFPCMPTSSNTTCVLLCFLFLFFCGGQPQVLSSSVTTEASFSPHVLHVTSSISRNVNKHNEPAGQGTVAPLCRWIRTQTHRLHSSAQTAWKNIRQEKRRGGERQQHTGGKRIGRGSQGVRLGNTSAAYQSQLLASLPLLPWQQRTVRHPGGRDGPKNLQLSLTSGERRNGASVCAAWLRYHFISTEEMLNRKDETLSMSQLRCDDRK